MKQALGIGGHHRTVGRTDDWLTPPWILALLGEFDLDPCAAPEPRPWATAREMWSLPDHNGLLESWFGRVWLNPPYGEETWKWLNRMALHRTGMVLIFARTDTEGFDRFVWKSADALLFLKGRPHFHHTDGVRALGNSGGPLVLVAYGKRDAAILQGAVSIGKFVDLERP